jgi:hypothetical protein
MLSDVSRVAGALREDTLAVAFANRREELLRKLHDTGECIIDEGERRFTITIRRSPDREAPVELLPR